MSRQYHASLERGTEQTLRTDSNSTSQFFPFPIAAILTLLCATIRTGLSWTDDAVLGRRGETELKLGRDEVVSIGLLPARLALVVPSRTRSNDLFDRIPSSPPKTLVEPDGDSAGELAPKRSPVVASSILLCAWTAASVLRTN